jgi:hypothetical protein
VAEWFNTPDLKSGDPRGSVGSNPTASDEVNMTWLPAWLLMETHRREEERKRQFKNDSTSSGISETTTTPSGWKELDPEDPRYKRTNRRKK